MGKEGKYDLKLAETPMMSDSRFNFQCQTKTINPLSRDLILISVLQRTVSHAAVFNEELCAVLL